MKRSLIIILIFVAILAIGVGVYFAWNKSRQILTPPTVTVPAENQNQQAVAAEEPKGKLKAISAGEVSAYWIHQSASSSEIYYLDKEGFLFREKSGGDEKILNQPILGVNSLTADKDGKVVAIESAGGIVVLTVGESGIIIESLTGAVSASFSPDSDKMAYFEELVGLKIRDYSRGLRSPITSTALSLNFSDASVKWIAENKIILSSRPSAYYIGEAWMVDVNKKTISPFARARGLYFNWSRDGKTAARFSVNETFNPNFSLIDLTGSVLAKFDFSSLPEKCFIGDSKIYCAVSMSNTSIGGLVLPDDYLKRKIYFTDWIYEMDAKSSGAKLVYFDAKKPIDAHNLTVLENRVFFINRYDNKLYELELP